MKRVYSLILVLAGFIACNKETGDSINSNAVSEVSQPFADTARVPINDLGKGTYLGFTGGLYPGGTNKPPAGYAADLLAFASSIKPLNPAGVGDSSLKGKIGFISIGGSTCGDLMIALKNKTNGNPKTNPFLHVVNCADGGGGASLNSVMNPNDPYWNHVDLVLRSSFINNRQIQVMYFETEDSTNLKSFPARPYQYRDELEVALRLFKTRFPNLKLVYFVGRTTTFHKSQIPNIEPCPYYAGWGQKFVVQDQINGVAGTKYKGDSAVAPLTTWAWYEWANGTNVPRKDGFVWQESQTTDGLHATDAGLDTLSSRFQNFLFTDPAANRWYANHHPFISPR